jgi:hypothetical protein
MTEVRGASNSRFLKQSLTNAARPCAILTPLIDYARPGIAMAFYHNLKDYQRAEAAARAAGREIDYPDKADWIAARLLELRTHLRDKITGRRRAKSLIIGSWNIRAFDDGRPRMDES